MRSILTALQEGRLFELPESNKAKALEFLARILDANPDIEVGTDTIEEIKHREQECNTGIGMGVGVPHVRARREEGELFCAIGWTTQGIEYGAGDGKQVHLVVMYYIPGAQKNVYLKEISSLVKAIRKAGGMEQIAHAADLNEVRNLLLDFVSAVSGEAGPEAVARMIKLEVRQAQAPVAASASPVASVPQELSCLVNRKGPRVQSLSILIAPPANPLVLCQDPDLGGLLEKSPNLAQSLSEGLVVQVNGHQVYTASLCSYPQGRVLYQCVALPA